VFFFLGSVARFGSFPRPILYSKMGILKLKRAEFIYKKVCVSFAFPNAKLSFTCRSGTTSFFINKNCPTGSSALKGDAIRTWFWEKFPVVELV